MLLALAKPWFSISTIRWTSGNSAAIVAAEPSDEALRTTISSKAGLSARRRTEGKATPRIPVFRRIISMYLIYIIFVFGVLYLLVFTCRVTIGEIAFVWHRGMDRTAG